MKERFSANASACYHCAARVFINGEYVCNEAVLDDKSVNLKVARYAPLSCPRGFGKKSTSASQVTPEILLRKLLNK